MSSATRVLAEEIVDRLSKGYGGRGKRIRAFAQWDLSDQVYQMSAEEQAHEESWLERSEVAMPVHTPSDAEFTYENDVPPGETENNPDLDENERDNDLHQGEDQDD